MVVARVWVGLAVGDLDAAVLVVQQDEADADRAEGEAGDEAEALRGREPADLVEHLARGLGAGNVRVDARREGEQDALRAHAGLEPEVPHGADHHGHAREEVHGAGLGHREAAGPDEQEEVAELLDELVVDRARRHDPALAALAPQERVGDEDTVHEVVPEVAEEDVEAERHVAVRRLRLGDGRLVDADVLRVGRRRLGGLERAAQALDLARERELGQQPEQVAAEHRRAPAPDDVDLTGPARAHEVAALDHHEEDRAAEERARAHGRRERDDRARTHDRVLEREPRQCAGEGAQQHDERREHRVAPRVALVEGQLLLRRPGGDLQDRLDVVAVIVLQVVAVELELDGEVLRVEGVVGRTGARGRLQGVEGGVEVRVEDELVALVVRDRIRYVGARVRLDLVAVPAEAPRGGQAAVPVGVALGALLHERLDVDVLGVLDVMFVLLELDGHVLREDRVVFGRRHCDRERRLRRAGVEGQLLARAVGRHGPAGGHRRARRRLERGRGVRLGALHPGRAVRLGIARRRGYLDHNDLHGRVGVVRGVEGLDVFGRYRGGQLLVEELHRVIHVLTARLLRDPRVLVALLQLEDARPLVRGFLRGEGSERRRRACARRGWRGATGGASRGAARRVGRGAPPPRARDAGHAPSAPARCRCPAPSGTNRPIRAPPPAGAPRPARPQRGGAQACAGSVSRPFQQRSQSLNNTQQKAPKK